MEIVKKLKAHIIYKKRSGRYGVKNSIGKWINGEEKRNILLAEGLIKIAEPKKVEVEIETPVEEAVEAAPATETVEETPSAEA